MYITVTTDLLVQAINHVSKAVSPRTVIPILSGIKFDASDDGLTLTASDSDVSIAYHIPRQEDDQENVILHEKGRIVLPAKFIIDMVKKLPADQITIQVQAHLLTSITSGTVEYHLHGLNADEYPRLPQIDEELSFYVPSMLLKNLIRQVAFSASTSESRPILTGIQWNLNDQELTFIGTDSHRLAKSNITVQNNSDIKTQSVVVPVKSLNELNKILEEDQEPVEILISGSQLLLRAKNLLFYSRLLEGNYPETSRIIPQSYKSKITLHTKHLHDALERASLIVLRDRNNVVKVSTISDKEIEIYSFSPEIGKLSETVSVAKYEGEELKISFNAKYMLDALKVIDSQSVDLSFNGATSPFLIHPEGDERTLHLIVPVRNY